MTIKAELLASSAYKTKWGFHVISTLNLKYPRFIHPEIMTHRDFSRNSSSSRAVPVEKIIAQIEEDMAEPVEWGAARPGMQAGEQIASWGQAQIEWQQAGMEMVYRAKKMLRLGIHKQVVNRMLEPWSHISVVLTSTQWKNFFDLRLALNEEGRPLADPTMYALALAMKEALESEPPRLLMPGEWHLPFVRDGAGPESEVLQSAAMCARVSYLTHEGQTPTREKNEALATRLLRDKHMSPFEHQARPARGRYANFHSWRSFRFDLENPEEEYRLPWWKYTPYHKNKAKPEIREHL